MYKYCGPYWSDGKFQQSVRGKSKPENELDECCMYHDADYYDARMGQDTSLYEADGRFIECAMQQGVTGNLMAGAVAISRKLRGKPSSPADDYNMKKNLRTAKAVKATNQPKPKGTNIGAIQLSAPAAISSVFTSTPTKTRNIANGIVASGKEFIGQLEGNGVATFGLGKAAMISPAYFYGGVLGQLARSFSKYRFTKLIVHYIPKVSTSTGGQIVLCSQENITMPALRGETTSFLQRALVSGNGVMCPIWTPCKMKIQTDGKYRNIDAFTATDINENIFCDVQCYVQTSVSGSPGHLWLEYECELKENRLEPHSTILPVATGPGLRTTLQDKTASPTGSEPVVLSETTGLASDYANGTVFKAVFDIQGSTPATGTTTSNAWKVATKAVSASAGTITNSFTGDVIVGGMTVYLVVNGATDLYAYTSLEAAIAGSASGQMFYNQTGTSKASWLVDVAVVRFGNELLNNVQ